jgi:hypothetical protein
MKLAPKELSNEWSCQVNNDIECIAIVFVNMSIFDT